MKFFTVLLIFLFTFQYTSAELKNNNTTPYAKKINCSIDKSIIKSDITNIKNIQAYDDGPIPGALLCYQFNYDHFNFVVPYDLTEFPLFNLNPLAAFLFVTTMNEDKIRNLSVSQLKTRSYAGFGSNLANVYHCYYIKGFEEYNKQLVKIDEFDLTARKSEFIEKLVECWKNYNDEYEKLMTKEIKIWLGFGWAFKSKELTNEYLIKGEDYYNSNLHKFYHPAQRFNVTKENYNFDAQQMTFPFICLGRSCNGENWSWSRKMDLSFSSDISNYAKNGNFTDQVSLEMAKELVKDNSNGYFYAIVKIKKTVSNSYQNAGYVYLQEFDVMRFGMQYFSDKNLIYEKTLY